jgi:hypothetical protein
MSTRSTTHFMNSQWGKETEAIIYRHSDGYPKGHGKDLVKFLNECKKLADSRLDDPAYLAAKLVVFLADMFNGTYTYTSGKPKRVRAKSKLDFLSVGVVMKDPGDIEYRYVIDCGKFENGLPLLRCFNTSGPEKGVEVDLAKEMAT